MSLFCASRNKVNILVVQHSDVAPGGNFCKALVERGARLTVLLPLSGDALPSGDDGYDGLVVLGGPQHAFDDEAGPHFRRLMDLMLLFDRARKPVAGLCLGAQLLARAHGGRNWTLDTLEFGFIQHQLTGAGRMDPVLGGAALPPLMEFHEDTFDLPAGATLLIEGDFCRNQCFRVGNISYGFQPHIELDRDTIRSWLELFCEGEIGAYRRYRDLFTDEYFKWFREKLDEWMDQSERYCQLISDNWLALTMKRYIP